MSPESASAEVDVSPERLQQIYQEGFKAGTENKRPEQNPYFSGALAYSVEWLRGRGDGQDITPGISNLSPDLLKAKKAKLGLE